MKIDSESRKTLLAIARKAIVGEDWPSPAGGIFDLHAGAFVTLKKNGSLRGCIGRMVSEIPLAELVPNMARASAYEDTRFPPVSRGEIPELVIEISVLSPLVRANMMDILPGVHGVLLRQSWHSAVFLPQVATEQGWGKTQMLEHLSMKAGLPKDAYLDSSTEFSVFTALAFSEADQA